ncbi:hypothetical protein Taro_028341, partial [Colocasia esculenta]|nr:hypothetical protein [Colocasia esculenta]
TASSLLETPPAGDAVACRRRRRRRLLQMPSEFTVPVTLVSPALYICLFRSDSRSPSSSFSPSLPFSCEPGGEGVAGCGVEWGWPLQDDSLGKVGTTRVVMVPDQMRMSLVSPKKHPLTPHKLYSKASSSSSGCGWVTNGSRSRVRKLRTVDGVPGNSSEDSVSGHPSQALLPITQGASSAASASSSVAETSSWGRGTGRRGPSRGATERRLEPGHKWNVRVIGGYGMWYCWDRTPQTNKMLQHMTAMHKGWRGMLKSKHYKSKTFEDVVASVLPGVDPSDWRTMCEKWNTREEQDIAERTRQNRTHQNMTYQRGRTSIYQLKDDFVKTHQREFDRMEVFRMGRCKDLPDGTQRWVDDENNDLFERMTQMTTHSLQSDDAAPVSAEDAFRAIMGRDRPGRVCCAGKVETLRTWYGRGEGSSSSGGYHTQVQQLQNQNKKMEEMSTERSRDRHELKNMHIQML